ncbi:zinc finger protein 385B-like isoform X2 [Macrosteles quadrilineatus]|uniref:zinc finger protein 385B-like isoform X2 n=1 Tax=Macrosteles quadrilineatus TaxID=74068 RepID=UPI0023E33AE5|nr:zinc finger protein 385B-like isoform X2 [Macrosteles quadrilineatus]XP_054267739.1 zinc finger protein 385B-like isoform X2 [Macrosteles quadrilineatus]
MAAFPAVATVIGVSKEIAESGPLLATLAMDPGLMVQPPAPPMNLPEETEVEIKASDPVTQAVVDNIIGKLPTTKEQVRLKCEVCNIEVSGPEILQIHYAGSKHAKKLKAQELIKEIANSPNSVFVLANPSEGSVPNTKEFSCKICNVRLNSHLQLQQHLSGSKHKSKAEANKSNTVQVADTSGSNQDDVIDR